MKISVVQLEIKKVYDIEIDLPYNEIHSASYAAPLFCQKIGSLNVEHTAMIALDHADRIINFCFFFAIDDVYYKMIGGAEMTHDVSAIQTILSPVFDRYDISRAVLFGSVAKGTATDNSDLDLMVDSKLRGLKFVGFMEAVRQAVGMPVDILNISHIEKGSRIEHEINSTGVTIYEK